MKEHTAKGSVVAERCPPSPSVLSWPPGSRSVAVRGHWVFRTNH